MGQMNTWIEEYLSHCTFQKGVSPKTRKAYRIDLTQLSNFLVNGEIGKEQLQAHIEHLHEIYKMMWSATSKTFFRKTRV